MKWFKHMSASWDDERLARLVGNGGMEGLAMYGLYWRLLEIVASQMEGKTPSCSVQYPVTRWSLLLSLRGSLVFSTLSRLAVTGVVTVEREGSEMRVTIPNLLKYRDEYARKSGHSSDNIPPRTEVEGDTDTEVEQKQKKPLASTAVAVPAASVPTDRGKLLGTLPCTGGFVYEVRADDLARDGPLYPAVDVAQEYREMKGWLLADPKRQKTKAGIRRFMASWLARAQDQGPKQTNTGGTNGKQSRSDAVIASTQRVLADLHPAADGVGGSAFGGSRTLEAGPSAGRLYAEAAASLVAEGGR